ncbi:MvdC/MvdD family ATP grasp protein [Pseudoalteromonas sp. ZZD1]|uniref:MvdC/MvdD family ATP grasp protein n=1 Tax=Pseudoalteromonas sp. ZZD1 TaxID=3139395 RepID=UPI003BAB38BF
MKTVLIISYCEDYHVEKAIQFLKQKKANYFFLTLNEFPKNYSFNQSINCNSASATLENNLTKQKIELSEIGAVWLRKSANFSYLSTDMEKETNTFANDETEHALFSALYTLDCFWMSHPKSLRAAMWKGEQLKRATELGLNIPDTLISNDPCEIRAFYMRHKKIVFKVMSDPVIHSDTGQSVGVATTLIDSDMLENTEALRLIPNQFQAYIEKAYELRITIIGKKVFAAKIDSQVHPETKIDCRNLNVRVPMSVYKLPKELEDACLKLMKSYNLNYSALDFIVTPKGEYVFLENNPCGQFHYIEENVPELKMIEALTNTLLSACI